MTDAADQAQELAELQETLHRRHAWHPDALPTGDCLYCGAAVKNGVRWCDAECAWSWSYEKDRRRVNGSPD